MKVVAASRNFDGGEPRIFFPALQLFIATVVTAPLNYVRGDTGMLWRIPKMGSSKMSNRNFFFDAPLLAAVTVATFAWATTASADAIQTYGDVSQSGSDYTLTSSPAGVGYAGLYYDYSSTPITLASITNLSAAFTMQEGSFENGAPRFSIVDTTNNTYNEAYVYWGTPLSGGTFSDPNPGAAETTGNYASLASSDLRVQINGFNGDSTGASYITWAQFVAQDGDAQVGYITLDLDGGYTLPTAQQLLVTDFNVTTAAAATPLPAALPLFASGLGVLGLIARRRKRKAA